MGARVVMEKDLAWTVGKRLARQAGKVRMDCEDAIDSSAAISRATHMLPRPAKTDLKGAAPTLHRTPPPAPPPIPLPTE